MKNIFQVIILLTAVLTFSQEKLIGEYCSIPIGESDVTCIEFKKDNLFKYKITGCLGVSKMGSGKFELKNGSLNLFFDKKNQIPRSTTKITEHESKSEKEVKLQFKIKDENGFDIPANIIRLTNQKHFSFDEYAKVFTIDKNSLKANYKIEFIGYETVDIEIENNTDKMIEIQLFPTQAKIISDTKIIMKWEKINDNEFQTGTNLWDRFKKV
ncbi:hypothetical protein [Hanstruepera flava]|uniref:hypothetical protein n=1 Tax=Hanstruepera flava TaxID=2930218 RepID=UPI0020290BDE|nr:hypothetical protein [Hanstruepera flava]